jgi:hypothetical protein
MSREEQYDAVNKCESLEELSDVIKSFANEAGLIQGRTRTFNANNMANACIVFSKNRPNVLTREFGIRQQAMYIIKKDQMS